MVLSKSHGREGGRASRTIHVGRWNEFCATIVFPLPASPVPRTRVCPATWQKRRRKLCSVKGAGNERFMEEAIRWSYCHCFRAEGEREPERESEAFLSALTHSLLLLVRLRRGSSHPLAHISILPPSVLPSRRFKHPPPHRHRRRLRTPHNMQSYTNVRQAW